jgi:hypothetical protein
MGTEKKFYNYKELGIRWNYKAESAAKSAQKVISRLIKSGMDIKVLKLGGKKVLISTEEVLKIEKCFTKSRAA